jgi:limonene-1,2-epoxide hydrolase
MSSDETADNEALVRRFLGGMGPTIEDFKNTYRECLTDDVEWESVGSKPRLGLEESVRHVDELKAESGMEYCTIEILNLAAAGDVVLTERVDTMCKADGTPVLACRVMGTFVIRDEKIARYTDYLDTLGAARALGRI